MRVELVEVDTSGDIDRTSPVAALTEMGAFVRSVQAAVLDGRADGAVHSLKDMPTLSPTELVVAAFPERVDPWDVLVGSTLGALRPDAIVGTGSPRRIAQLKLIRPDIRTAELRGNVDTRIRKITEGEVDAAVLAAAGLQRLERVEAIGEVLDVGQMIPAPGQGVLAVEARAKSEAAELLQAIDDPNVRVRAETERLLLSETGAGCRSALGALATIEGTAVRLTAFVDDERGPRRYSMVGADPETVVTLVRRELDV